MKDVAFLLLGAGIMTAGILLGIYIGEHRD